MKTDPVKYLLAILLLVSAANCSGTTWSAALPYKQRIVGQDVYIIAYPYEPYRWSPMIGNTSVYYQKKLLYTIDNYYREKIVTSEDGQYLVVLYTTNATGVKSYSLDGNERVDVNQNAIEVFKNGQPFKAFALKDIVDTNKLEREGWMFNWGYFFDEKAFQEAEQGCRIYQAIYGQRVLETGDTSRIQPNELIVFRRQCDSMNLAKDEARMAERSFFLDKDTVFILTNQNTVLKLNLNTSQIQKLPLDEVIPDKSTFDPPKVRRLFKEISVPDQYEKPDLGDGRSFAEGVAELLGMTVDEKGDNEKYTLFVDRLLIDRTGKCLLFEGIVQSSDGSANAVTNEMFTKVSRWVNEQIFDTRPIPRGFDKYSFKFLVDLK